MRLSHTATTVLLLTLAACAVNPATGRRELMLVSEGQEVQMGMSSDPQVTAAYGLVDDPALQDYVSRLGMDIARASERPQLPWSFKVVDDPIVNAFALPGGFIYVTRGILANFDSEAELMGVLGHEVGHVTARHGASQMSRQQLQGAVVMVGAVASETFRNYAGLAMGGLQILNLSYSRGDESESDMLGLRYISELGYDPDAMIGVFDMLALAGGGGEGQRLPEWQLTHPYPENREADMRAQIAESGMSRDGTVGRDRYLDMIDGIVFGVNPRDGYFEDERFLHPDLAFELTFPSGWGTVNQKSMVGAGAPSEDAAVILTIAEGETTARGALDAFLSNEGMTAGAASHRSINGLTASRASFGATTEQGALAGEIAFIQHDALVYQILGYSTEAGWANHRNSVSGTISSFRPVTDRRVLDVQPMRLDIVTVPSAMSLERYVEQNGSPIDIEELRKLNRLGAGEVISGGSRIKVVRGTPVGR